MIETNVANLLWESAQREPERTAVVDRGVYVTYAELVARATAVGRALRYAGLAPGERVGILLERGADAATALFAVYAAGGVAVLMDEVLRPLQVEHVLAHSEARFLLTSPTLLARHPRGLVTTARVLDIADGLRTVGTLTPVPCDAGSLAQIVYTSGSTGAPKGVMISHANLESLVSVVNGYLGITREDRVAGLLPFSFVYGLGQVLCSVAAGATLVVERSPLPTQIVETLRDEKVTVLAGVPSLWARLLDSAEFCRAMPALRVMTNAGGALMPSKVRAMRRLHPNVRLFLMYGLTEALRCTFLSPDEVDAHPDSIGRAIPGSTLHLLREDGTVAAPGEVGEIVFAGPTVTMGYWRDEEDNERVFRPSPLPNNRDKRVVYTGDMARRDESGLLYYVGRRDRLIKTMGYRVAPNEVVSALHASGQVSDAEVVGAPDEQWGMVLIAHVVLEPHGSLDRLREYCLRELPRYLRPTKIHVRDGLPLTANGKHDLAALSLTM